MSLYQSFCFTLDEAIKYSLEYTALAVPPDKFRALGTVSFSPFLGQWGSTEGGCKDGRPALMGDW